MLNQYVLNSVGELNWFGVTSGLSDVVIWFCNHERFGALKLFGDTCCHAVSGSALAYCSGERRIDVDGSANLVVRRLRCRASSGSALACSSVKRETVITDLMYSTCSVVVNSDCF